MSIAAKNQKQKKEEQYAHYLYQIRTKGEQGILYADILPGQRHPYTQEVVQMARSRGMTQTYIGGKCGVSQSQVSKWEGGVDKATEEQLRPLIRRMSQVAPGNEFHHFYIAKSVFKTLEENDIRPMLAGHINREFYSHGDNYSERDLEEDQKTYGFEINYNRDVLPLDIELKYHGSEPEGLQEIAEMIFPDRQFSATVLDGDEVSESYEKILGDYIASSLEEKVMREEIQLCGTLLHSDKGLELYRLVNSKLALISRLKYECKEHGELFFDEKGYITSADGSEYLAYCELFDSADQLFQAVSDKDDHNLTQRWRIKLVEAGYILNDVKSVY